jgi:hypothetical protein
VNNTTTQVRRYFPTFDFVISTDLSRDAAIEVFTAAMTEPSTRHWPFPQPHISGEVQGSEFSGRLRTASLGGNAVSRVSGSIMARADGGADVFVRATNWFVILLPTALIALSLYFAFTTAGGRELLSPLGISAWIGIAAVGLYLLEMSFVRRVIERIVSTTRQPN